FFKADFSRTGDKGFAVRGDQPEFKIGWLRIVNWPGKDVRFIGYCITCREEFLVPLIDSLLLIEKVSRPAVGEGDHDRIAHWVDNQQKHTCQRRRDPAPGVQAFIQENNIQDDREDADPDSQDRADARTEREG